VLVSVFESLVHIRQRRMVAACRKDVRPGGDPTVRAHFIAAAGASQNHGMTVQARI
jgi:hypothetical protein